MAWAQYPQDDSCLAPEPLEQTTETTLWTATFSSGRKSNKKTVAPTKEATVQNYFRLFYLMTVMRLVTSPLLVKMRTM